MSVDLTNLGPAGQLRFAGRRSRSVISDAVGAIRYPSPFFDLGSMYLPSSFKTMLRWCRYYFLTNPIINAVVYKMAEYPVTDLIIDEQGENLRNQWDSFFKNTLQLKKTLVEIGLDYGAYGNAFVSLHYPFRKYLKCPTCGYANQVSRQKYTFRDYKFVGECNSCGSHVTFEPKDHYIKSAREIRLIRWNPEYVTIHHNEATGESKYYYTVPGTLSNDVRMSKRHVIESLPQPFIEAIKANKSILFSQDNIYHMKRPTIAQKDKGWGLPMILPVLKDTFYLAILRKAQEAIAVEHAVPLRILFPQTTSGTADPYCVSLDTLIETRDGLKPAAEVVAGDFIKTHAGRWLPVAAAVDRKIEHEEDVFEFSVSSLTAFPFKVSEGHPILVAKRDRTKKFRGYDSIGEPDWVLAKDVAPGDYACYPRRRVTWDSLELDLAEYVEGRAATGDFLYRRMNQQTAEIFEYFEFRGVPSFKYGERAAFLERMGWGLDNYNNARHAFTGNGTADRISRHIEVSKDLAYLIGIYAAEGSPKGTLASLALHSNETHIMDRVDEALESLGFEKGSRHFRGSSAQYDINDVFLGEFLKNTCGDGAQNKRLPRFILEAPTEVALEAVKAVVDGDGCDFSTATRRVGLKTASPHLAHGVRNILLSEGLIPCVQKNIPSEEENSVLPYYQVNLNGVQADAALRLFNGEERGPVRSSCGFIRGDFVYLRVRKSERVGDVDVVRGFQVDGDKSFCVAGVATHNTTINISDWKRTVEQEIMRWRLDNNYIPVMPMPVGQETLGGDGRALMLAQEYRIWVEYIISGMGVPLEFIQGGLSYSGSNVSLRMLENHFLDQKADHLHLVNDFIIPKVAAFMGWSKVSGHFKKFKMADDLQRSAFNLQLNQAGKISDHSLLEDTDWDAHAEAVKISEEQKRTLENQRNQALGQASIQGEAQLAMSKYQMKAQKAMASMQADPQMLAQQQQEGAGMQQITGAPGMASPNAAGQMMSSEMEMMNQTGAIPPMEMFQEQAQQQQAQEAGIASGQARRAESAQQPQPAPPPAQQAMVPLQSPLNAGQNRPAGPVQTLVNRVVGMLDQLPANERQGALMHMARTSPQLLHVVRAALETRRGAHVSSAALPAPEQRAPRRGPEATVA